MKRFANSVQHITGQELEVKAASDTDSMSIVEQEMEALRTKVDELSEEVKKLIVRAILILTCWPCYIAHRFAQRAEPANRRNEYSQVLTAQPSRSTFQSLWERSLRERGKRGKLASSKGMNKAHHFPEFPGSCTASHSKREASRSIASRAWAP